MKFRLGVNCVVVVLIFITPVLVYTFSPPHFFFSDYHRDMT